MRPLTWLRYNLNSGEIMTEKKKAPVWITDGSDNLDIEVVLIFQRHGQTFELKHLFREPTAADKRARARHLSRTKIQRQNRNYVETDYTGASEKLYDRCIKEVTGYDVDSSKSAWKSSIPIDHKTAAVEKMLSESGLELDEDDSKN